MSSLGDYSLTLVTPPAVEPVDLDTVKKHCRVSHDDDDTLFTIWMNAARQLIETETNCRLIEQTWRLNLCGWPDSGRIELPLQPIISIESVKYLDSGSVLQTLVVDDDYLIDGGRKPPFVYASPSSFGWPMVKSGRTDSVRIEFKAGFGDEAGDVPDLAKNAILLTVAYWDQNRGDEETVGQKLGLPPGALRLLNLLDQRGYR